MTKKSIIRVLGCTVMLLSVNNIYAALNSTTANYQVTLGSACTVTATGASFGTYPIQQLTLLNELDAGSIAVNGHRCLVRRIS